MDDFCVLSFQLYWFLCQIQNNHLFHYLNQGWVIREFRFLQLALKLTSAEPSSFCVSLLVPVFAED